MFEIKLTNKSTYSEMDQPNPLRWKIMLRDGNIFTDQTGWIKCKDFFNDVVAFLQSNKQFNVYRFKNAVKANDEGIYLLLKHVVDDGSFDKNLEVLNKQLEKDLNCTITTIQSEKGRRLLLLPIKLWSSTFLISLVSLCIRLCNYGVVYTDWKSFWTSIPIKTIERGFDHEAGEWVSKIGFKLPQKLQEYWGYMGHWNSKEKDSMSPGMIHDNGVCSWYQYKDA